MAGDAIALSGAVLTDTVATGSLWTGLTLNTAGLGTTGVIAVEVTAGLSTGAVVPSLLPANPSALGRTAQVGTQLTSGIERAELVATQGANLDAALVQQMENVVTRTPGGTGQAYDKLAGQGLYVLRNEDQAVKYVGRGDAPARIAAHANTPGKDVLVGEVLWDNNLTNAQANGLENCLMNYCGGPLSQNPESPLLNIIRSYAPKNPNSSTYDAAATSELWEETVRRLDN